MFKKIAEGFRSIRDERTIRDPWNRGIVLTIRRASCSAFQDWLAGNTPDDPLVRNYQRSLLRESVKSRGKRKRKGSRKSEAEALQQAAIDNLEFSEHTVQQGLKALKPGIAEHLIVTPWTIPGDPDLECSPENRLALLTEHTDSEGRAVWLSSDEPYGKQTLADAITEWVYEEAQDDDAFAEDFEAAAELLGRTPAGNSESGSVSL